MNFENTNLFDRELEQFKEFGYPVGTKEDINFIEHRIYHEYNSSLDFELFNDESF